MVGIILLPSAMIALHDGCSKYSPVFEILIVSSCNIFRCFRNFLVVHHVLLCSNALHRSNFRLLCCNVIFGTRFTSFLIGSRSKSPVGPVGPVGPVAPERSYVIDQV